jgi:hypothetical protein
MQSIFRAWNVAATPIRRRRSAPSLRNRKAAMGVESLEQRMALTAAPFIGLAPASDTGARGDGITRIANPVFTGVAPARSMVSVFADGQLLGTTKASVRGAWSLRTPAPLVDGGYTITGTAVLGVQPPIALRPLSMVVDRTPPTASLTYDVVNGRATLTFSEPVSGVRAANLILSGRSQSGVTVASVPIKDSRAEFYVGTITISRSSDGKTFTFQEQLTLAEPGRYTLAFVRKGVTDLAGNLPAAGASTPEFKID